MPLLARSMVMLCTLLITLLSVGCAHAVRITSAPGAAIYVDGQHVGTPPATSMETTGGASSVSVTAKKDGREASVVVAKDNVDWGAVAGGAFGGRQWFGRKLPDQVRVPLEGADVIAQNDDAHGEGF